MRQIDLDDAYKVLGLSRDAPMEEVKNSYKKLALQFHPDKNTSPDATERFQEIGAAYTRVVKHVENPDLGEGHYWDDDGNEGEEMDLDFFMYMFSRMFAGAQARRGGGGGGGIPVFMSRGMFAEREEHRRKAEEADRAAYFAKRKEQNLQAQLEAQKKEVERLKQQKEEEIRRQAERIEQKKRKKDGRAKAQQQQKQMVQDTRRASQKKRSEVFKMARSGDAEGVKKGIWEQNVDAAGGECLVGMKDDPVFSASWKDPDHDLNETFLHIFARHRELDMVKWLIDHNAEVEERDSWNRTAFHVALQYGHIPLISFFIETFPPALEDSLPIFEPPKNPSCASREYSLLRLAMDSLSLPTVRFIIHNDLFERGELEEAWDYIMRKGQAGPGKGYGDELAGHADISSDEKLRKAWSSIRDLLKKHGNFQVSTPPPPPTLPTPEQSPSRNTSSLLQPDGLADSSPSTNQADAPFQKKKKTKKPKKKLNKADTSQGTIEPEASSTQHPLAPQTIPETSKFNAISSTATSVKSTEHPSIFPSIKDPSNSESTPAKFKTRDIQTVENVYPSPTSGYPSSPEATARHEHLHNYSHTPHQAHQPSRVRRRSQKHNIHHSKSLGDTGNGITIVTTDPTSNGGQYQAPATAPATGDSKSDEKGASRNTHTNAETAVPIPTSTSHNTTNRSGPPHPGGTNGTGEGSRGRKFFRGEARRGRGTYQTHDGHGAAEESTGGGQWKSRGADANGPTGGSESCRGHAEGSRGRGYRGRGRRGRGGSASGRAAGGSIVAETHAA